MIIVDVLIPSGVSYSFLLANMDFYNSYFTPYIVYLAFEQTAVWIDALLVLAA